MSRKILTALDLTKNELQNAVAQNLAAAPSSPVKGQFYFDTTANVWYWYDGTAWVAAKAASPATTVTTQAVGDAAVVGTALTYAREDHKHGREAFGVITAQTTFGLAKADGSAVTLARSDHVHGTPSHAAADHSGIKLSDLAAPTATVNMGGQVVSNVAAPSAGTDAANKTYVDNLTAGLSWKEAVRAATTVNGTLATAFANGQVIDGVTLVTGDRILLKNQTTTSENGIFVVTAGAPTRSTDADAVGELEQATVFVAEGTTNADTAWVCTTNGAITPGTTGTAWAQFSSAGGGVPTNRTITTTAPVRIDGGASADLSANRTLSLAANGVDNTFLAQMPTLTMKGNNTGATANAADLTAAQVKTLLALTPGTDVQAYDSDLAALAANATNGYWVRTGAGTGVARTFGSTSTIAAANGDGVAGATGFSLITDAVDNTFLSNMAQATIKGRASGAGTGDPTDLTSTQATAILDVFTSALKGLAPASGGGTTTFLRADGTWAAPAGGGTVNKYANATIGGAVSQVVTHNLNTQAVVVNVYRTLTPWDTIECDVERTTVNTITLRFSVAPATNEYSVVVLG